MSLLTTILLSTSCAPNNVTNTGVNVSSTQGGTGIIKGKVSAEGFKTSSFNTKANPELGLATIKASSSIDTKEVKLASDGSFSIEVKGGADYKLEAIVPDGFGGTLKVVNSLVKVPLSKDPAIVDVKSLVTKQTGSIQGLIQIENAKEGENLEGADVYIAGTSIVGKARDKGRFALTEIAEGTWDIVISKQGFERAYVKGVEVKAGKARLVDNVILKRSSNESKSGIKGIIQDANGAAIVGASVTVYAKDKADSFTAISDEKGEYNLLNLPTGDYQIQIYRAFYELPARKEVSIKADKTEDLGVTKLTSTVVFFGKIKGKVVDEDGNAIDGAVIQTLPQVTDQQFADAAGNFTLDRVLPGEYSASVSAGGYCTLEMSLRVENTENYMLNLEKPIILSKKVGEDGCSQVVSAGSLPVLPPSPQKGNQEESLRALLDNPNPNILKIPKKNLAPINKVELQFVKQEIVFERVNYLPGIGNIDYFKVPDIYLYSLSGQTNLTPSGDNNLEKKPVWSSNGDKVVWISKPANSTGIYHPYVINADGNNIGIRSAGNNDINDISWSPDDLKFVLSLKIDDSTNNIYTMDNSGANKVLLTPLNASQPNWSVKTDKIAFKSGYDIYSINSDGTNQIKLTNNTENNAKGDSGLVIDSLPNWSPDGSKIAFTRSTLSRVQNKSSIVVDLYVMNKDGSNVTQLTNTPDESEFNANWSPDGKYIVFESLPATGVVSNYAGINIMNADGSNRYVLLANEYTKVYKSPDWRKVP